MPTPEWWLLMARRGVPYHPDAGVALQAAKERIATYTGQKQALTLEQQALVQGIVMDALVVAPQPVGKGWVNTTLMAVAGLVRWAVAEGEDLDRENLFAVSTRNRFLNLGCRGMKPTSVTNYRCRLDLVAAALSGVAIQPATSRKGTHEEVVNPHTPVEVASMWMWAQGARPAQRSQRLAAALTLGLGCGLKAGEVVAVRREDVTRDEHGVHVQVTVEGGQRRVTCMRAWEDRLWTAVEVTPENHYVSSPWRDTPVTGRMLQNVLRSAQISVPPPVLFSMRSLRNTWMVAHLTAGTPLPTLMAAAGIDGIEAVGPYLPHVPVASEGEQAARLRDVR